MLAALTVAFGTNAATNVVVLSDTQITATAPAGSGTANVTVTTSSGTTPAVPAGAFTYLVAPDFPSSFAPASILAGATSTLTITLSNPNATAATLSASLVDGLPGQPRRRGDAERVDDLQRRCGDRHGRGDEPQPRGAARAFRRQVPASCRSA